jgi:hypothetical protein
MIKRCVCEHPFQDRRYGAHMRVANVSGDGKKYRCTVCGKEIITTVRPVRS